MGIEISNSKGDMYTAEAIEGMDLAIDIGADVISISVSFLGTHASYQQDLDEIEKRNIIIVSAAGNSGEVDPYRYPCASVNVSNNICVGALSDKSDLALAPYSNYGPQVHIAAFGTNVVTSYSSWDKKRTGTSYAVPFVTGTVGILLGMGIKPEEIRPLLMRYASPLDKTSHQIHPDGGALDILNTIKGAISEAGLEKKDGYRLQ